MDNIIFKNELYGMGFDCLSYEKTCPECGGSGYDFDGGQCPECGGLGTVESSGY